MATSALHVTFLWEASKPSERMIEQYHEIEVRFNISPFYLCSYFPCVVTCVITGVVTCINRGVNTTDLRQANKFLTDDLYSLDRDISGGRRRRSF